MGRRAGWAGSVVAILAAALAGSSAAAEPPRRIVSINLCADQYLLALVPRDHIVALSPFADDPSVSGAADEARGIPKVRDDVESVLSLKPDLVVASAYTKPSTIALLQRYGLDVFAVLDATNFAELREQINVTSKALDAPEKGAVLKRNLDTALARLQGQGEGRRVLYLDRGGFVTGSRTLIGAAFAHAGLANAAESLGVDSIAPVSLEIVLLARPEIIVTPDRGVAQDQGALSLRHPALASLTGSRTIHLPVSDTVCPGPSWIGAIDRLASGLARD